MKTITLISTILIFYSSLSAGISPVKNDLNFRDKSRKLVVIDAGHGGHDSGALGKKSKEKELTLQMALKLGDYLTKTYPFIDVEYTRKTDEFIPLYQRVGIANKRKADLFISIHCNFISNAHTRGTETFVMGLHRAQENLEVARRENEVILLENDYESNYEGYDPNSPVGHIVLSSFQDAYLSQSLDFAAKIEKNLAKRSFSSSRGVKQAGFAVLRRATMPSVLIETGFISNPDEERKLMSDEGQLQICKSIAEAVSDFFGDVTDIPNNKVANAPVKKEPDTNKKEENKKSSAGFRVQIAAMKTELGSQFKNDFKDIGDLIVLNENDYFKYQVGTFDSMEEAQKAKLKLMDKGFKGAFVIKYD